MALIGIGVRLLHHPPDRGAAPPGDRHGPGGDSALDTPRRVAYMYSPAASCACCVFSRGGAKPAIPADRSSLKDVTGTGRVSTGLTENDEA